MTTTGNPWDDDPRRPQRVRIRRPAPGGAGPWDGPDVPAPRPPDPAPGPHYAEAPYAPDASYPYPPPPYPGEPYGPEYPPEYGYPAGPAYPESPAYPEDPAYGQEYGYPADPGPGHPYPGGAGHPYQPDAGGPDLSTGYLYVGRGDQGGGPGEGPPPGYGPEAAGPPDLYGYERGRGSFVPGPADEAHVPPPAYAPTEWYEPGSGYQAGADWAPALNPAPNPAPDPGYGPDDGYVYGEEPGYGVYGEEPGYGPAVEAGYEERPAYPPGPPGFEFGYQAVPEPVQPRPAADDFYAPPSAASHPQPDPESYAQPGSEFHGQPGPERSAPPSPEVYAEPGSGRYAEPGSGRYAEPGRSPYGRPGYGPYAGTGRGPYAEPGRGPYAGPGVEFYGQPGSELYADPGYGPYADPGYGPYADPGYGPYAHPGYESGPSGAEAPPPRARDLTGPPSPPGVISFRASAPAPAPAPPATRSAPPGPSVPYARPAPSARPAPGDPSVPYARPLPPVSPVPPAPRAPSAPDPGTPSGPPGFEFTGSGSSFSGTDLDPSRRSQLALPPAPGQAGPGTAEADDEFAAARADRAGPATGPLRQQASSPRTRGRREAKEAQDRTRPGGRGPGRDHPLPSPLSKAGIKHWAVRAALPMVSMVALGVALVAAFGGGLGGAGPNPNSLSAGFPPATTASNDFGTLPAEQARGIDQVLTTAASSGTRVVVTGSQTGARIKRAQFLVSSDGGQTWSLGAEQAAGGGQPAPGHPATLIAGGAGHWVAIGPDSVWTSGTGTSWTLQSVTGITPVQAGDQVTVLRRTATGFLAAGRTAAGGPVVWISATGTSWQRLGPSQLRLTAPGGGMVGEITEAASVGHTTVIAARTVPQGTAFWRSTNGGSTWSRVTVPASHGASGALAGLTAAGGTLVAVRPGQQQGKADAVVFTSADGQNWKFGATITGPDGAALTVQDISGGPNGAAISAASAGGAVLAFTSANGASWQAAGTLSTTNAGTITGLATLSNGAVVAAGSLAGQVGQQPQLSVDHAGQVTPVSVAAIPGATEPELALDGITASGSNQVAVGSANGFPATWFSSDAGTTWSRGTGASPTVLNRPGLQQLSSVAEGNHGWVAVGGVQAGANQHPVVVTSATGRSWQAADGATPFGGAGLFTSAVAAGPAGYVIVGREVSGGRTIAAAWWSAGLTGWQRAAGAAPGALDQTGADHQMLAVTGTSGGFAAVGSTGTHPAAWTSVNGKAWQAVTLAVPSSAGRAQLSHVTVNGHTLVATGTATSASGQTAPFAATSKDGGTTWTESVLPSPRGTAAVTAVAATGGGFTAVGTFGVQGGQDVVIWTSPDGRTWKPNSPSVTGLGGQGIQEITALTVSGSTLTGVGFTATPTRETPTIWRSPIRN